MTKLIITISFLLFVGSPFANAEQVYYCTSELATGIMKDKKTGEWESKRFELERYTIKFNYDFTKLDGIGNLPFGCLRSYPGIPEAINFITCYSKLDTGDIFLFDKQTHRFFYVYGNVAGYLRNKKNSDTNTIYAGTCQKF